MHESNQHLELVDKRLKEFDEQQVKRLIIIAFLCTQTAPAQRPIMSRVMAMLCGDAELGTIPSKPTYLEDWAYDGSSLLTTEISDYSNIGNNTSTSYSTPTQGTHSPTDSAPLNA